jgi:hypothetical protein
LLPSRTRISRTMPPPGAARCGGCPPP